MILTTSVPQNHVSNCNNLANSILLSISSGSDDIPPSWIIDLRVERMAFGISPELPAI